MRDVLNTVIKFDLHIHSKASEYKESAGIVENSTKENISILLSKLNQYNVALFSITDHNRFDSELYLEINRNLSQDNHPYPNVKAVLAGIEFDVILDDEMDKCHIVTIFDANGEPDKLKRIETALQNNLLEDVQGAYSKKNYEDILKEIGLNTILIALQRKNIHNQNGRHNSLSDSTSDVEQIIKIGYISALEFQKPKVEGILLNNLKELSLPIALFSGSDCHDWSYYPYHNANSQTADFHHSKAKILPTFKGLLMAVTSPETRFNCSENPNTSIISSLTLKGEKLPLVNGINAIIGENGSGKTTLLKVINGKLSEKYVKKLVSDNSIEAENSINPQNIKYIEQGQIIKNFNDKTLFTAGEESNFKELDNTQFTETYTNFSDAIKANIIALIERYEKLNALSQNSITFDEKMVAQNYFVDITEIESIESTDNPHEKARKDISDLLKKAKSLLADSYYTAYKEQIERVVAELSSIHTDIEQKWLIANYEATAKNILCSYINEYLQKIKENSSAKDREIKEYDKKKNQVIQSVIAAVKASVENIDWPNAPPIIEGATKSPKHGFYFNREAEYNGISMLDSYFAKMFVKNYNSIESLNDIKSYDKFSGAIRSCVSTSDINTKWKENFDKFMNDAVKSNDFIMDGSENKVGNTLGEMSLSYYKFYTQDDKDWRVLIVDQPEDNISNNNISQKLIRYFNAIRDDKQIIFVTHNPLLVVNLDVDNVVFVKNDNGGLSANNGCLEYEDEKVNIIELIAQNMDGGKETIEKRLKVYGKSY